MFLSKLYRSFKFAVAGMRYCVRNERNFRIHTVAAITVCLISPFYRLDRVDVLLLALVVSLVIICEMFNTALEAVIDLVTRDYNDLAKIAKDVSAGAVLVAAICAAVYGVVLFAKWDTILEIAAWCISSPWNVIFTVIYIFASAVFIVV